MLIMQIAILPVDSFKMIYWIFDDKMILCPDRMEKIEFRTIFK